MIELPAGGLPNRVFMDRLAYEADGTVVINRVKPHTDFHGPHESGLLKMCAIGLGKRQGAEEIHRHGVEGLKEFIAFSPFFLRSYGATPGAVLKSEPSPRIFQSLLPKVSRVTKFTQGCVSEFTHPGTCGAT